MISGPSVKIQESKNGITIEQLDSVITISNINDINILLDILNATKHKFLMQRSLNYKYVYEKINE